MELKEGIKKRWDFSDNLNSPDPGKVPQALYIDNGFR